MKLTDQAGKWVVIYFYPKDDTPGCTTEALEFTDLANDFETANTVVFGVSPDSCEKHAKFIEKHGLGVRLLADPKKTVLTKYDAFGIKKMYGKEVEGVKRSTVIVDPKGKVAHHWKSVRAKGHAAKVLETVQKLQAG